MALSKEHMRCHKHFAPQDGWLAACWQSSAPPQPLTLTHARHAGACLVVCGCACLVAWLCHLNAGASGGITSTTLLTGPRRGTAVHFREGTLFCCDSTEVDKTPQAATSLSIAGVQRSQKVTSDVQKLGCVCAKAGCILGDGRDVALSKEHMRCHKHFAPQDGWLAACWQSSAPPQPLTLTHARHAGACLVVCGCACLVAWLCHRNAGASGGSTSTTLLTGPRRRTAVQGGTLVCDCCDSTQVDKTPQAATSCMCASGQRDSREASGYHVCLIE